HEKGGKAAPRGGKQGAGRWILDLLNEHTRHTGLTFTWRKVGPGLSAADVLRIAEPALAKGIPVPFVVGTEKSSHCTLITAMRHKDGQIEFNIHDPWTGQTVTRTAIQLTSGHAKVAGHQKLYGVYVPAVRS